MRTIFFSALLCAIALTRVVTQDDLQDAEELEETAEQMTCPLDTPMVSCFANPCPVSQCNVPGAVCRVNFCGRCKAVWRDAEGDEIEECNEENNESQDR